MLLQTTNRLLLHMVMDTIDGIRTWNYLFDGDKIIKHIQIFFGGMIQFQIWLIFDTQLLTK